MKWNQRWVPKIIKAGLLLMAWASMSACAGLFNFGDTSWKEEVLLHDGSTIIVGRTVSRGGRHEIGQEPPIKEQRLSFNLPGTNEGVVWEDKFSEDVGGASFLPMQLEVKKDTAYLVVYPMGCLSYNKWGRPNPPYVVFQYQGKEWTRITLQELPSEFKLPNLVISSPDSEVRKTGLSLVPVEIVKKMNADFKQPEFKTIMREPLEGAGAECGEMVSNGKGGWVGMGWFRDQKSYDACVSYCFTENMDAQHCPCKTLFRDK